MKSSLSSTSIVYQYSDRDTEEPQKRRRKVEQTGTTRPELVKDDDIKALVELFAAAVKNPVVNDQPYESSDEDEVDPDLKEAYYRQIRESNGFDVDITIPNASLFVTKCKNENHYYDRIGMSARVGLHWYNFEKGSNFQLSRVEKYNSVLCGFGLYITLEATDPSNKTSCFTFQTYVIRDACRKGEELSMMSEGCRIKPQIQGTGDKLHRWKDIDEAYKGSLPKWYSDDALMPSSDNEHRHFFQLKDSDIQANDWLNMYAEIALYSLREGDWSRTMFESCMPLKIKKVVVQTYEEDAKSKEKLRAKNAIFYISFKNLNGPLQEDYRAIVRRTVDGLPGHVRLGFKCWLVE